MRVCHLRPDDVGALNYKDFAIAIDNIDDWLKIELRLKEVSLLG